MPGMRRSAARQRPARTMPRLSAQARPGNQHHRQPDDDSPHPVAAPGGRRSGRPISRTRDSPPHRPRWHGRRLSGPPENLDRVVALKILPPEMAHAPAFAQRFAREAQAMARLNHPHIVTIYEFGERSGWYFFIMEFVDGLNLRQCSIAATSPPKKPSPSSPRSAKPSNTHTSTASSIATSNPKIFSSINRAT